MRGGSLKSVEFWLKFGLQACLYQIRLANMPMTMSTQIRLQLTGDIWGEGVRELIVRDDDAVEASGTKYLLLTPHLYSHIVFVASGAEGMGRIPKGFSLTRSVGLQRLLAERNAVAWPEPVDTPGLGRASSLFEGAPPSAKRYCRRTRLAEDAPPTISITLPSVGSFSDEAFEAIALPDALSRASRCSSAHSKP